MALRSVLTSKLPIVVILGATGTGKTKLGVELAQKYVTEIISSDSMQIYKGLDLVTAKASPHERDLVHHHLLDILEPHQVFTVVDFRNRALKIIDSLTLKGKMPLIVGGTVYYLESIIYKILVEDSEDAESLLWHKSRRKRDDESNETSEIPEKKINLAENITEVEVASPSDDKNEENVEIDKEKLREEVDNEKRFSNEEIHSKLKSIDPVMAARLHPNNRRKVLRSIEVWLKTGRRHSEVLAEQKQSEGQLRRPGATIILWLKCEQSVHDERLDKRVDSMLEQGLIQELLDFHDRHNKQRIKDGVAPDYTKGVFQTLGFKEFHDYLMLSEEERVSDDGQKLLKESIENMKRATRRYARRQNKMIRGRFLNHPDREVPPIYELDTTDISKWDEEVNKKAVHIINSFLNETQCQYEPLKAESKGETSTIDGHSNNYCVICQRLIIGDKEYDIHLKSNRHLRVIKIKRKMELQKARENNK